MALSIVPLCRVPANSWTELKEQRGRSIRKSGNSRDEATDDNLVAAMVRGESAALGELLNRHSGRIAVLARRMLGPGGDADDIVQETFLRLWTRAAFWQPGRAKLTTWLHRVAVNLTIDRLRRSSPVSLDEAPEPVDQGPLPDAGLASRDATALIDRAMMTLAPRQRMAITLCHYSGLTNIEAAEIMGISVDAMESLLARGRRSLKHMLMADRYWLLDTASLGTMPAPANTEDGANEI